MNIKYSFQHTNTKPNEQLFSERILPYINDLKDKQVTKEYNFDECSMLLPFDQKHFEISTEIADKYNDPEVELIVLIGIGGSNLGASAILSALSTSNTKYREVIFVDTTDPGIIQEALTKLETTYQRQKKAFLILVSKSGTTPESISNFGMLYEKFKHVESNYKEKLFVITMDGTPLWDFAISEELILLDHISMVGGRYSVMSNVGIFPLTLAGVNTESLLSGARTAVDNSLNQNLNENQAAQSALTLYQHMQEKRNIYNLFIFSKALENAGKWYRQLMGESTGKQRQGMTPIISIGSVDLHSVAQLFFEGPDDKYTTLLNVKNSEIDYSMPNNSLDTVVNKISKYSSQTMFASIYQGVVQAYIKSQLPFSEISFHKIDEATLGEFMQFKMIEIMFLAKLMNVNAFDQPGVELYKEETRQILKKI